MKRSFNKDSDVAASTPGRRSLRNSKPPEEEVKSIAKVRKYVGKKKEDKAENKNEESKKDSDNTNCSKNNQTASDIEGETASPKPTTSRRSGRKRQLSEGADIEADDDKSNGKKDEKEDEKEDDKSDDKKDDKNDDNEESEQSNEKVSSQLKNGKAEDAAKVKTKKKRKPPTKKKKEEDESELWTPLESLDDDDKKDTQPKAQSKSESKRKQALVERQAPADPMLQKQPPRHRRTSGGSECEVLVSVPRTHRRSKTIVTVDIDDEASETGSIQIVAEPDVDSVFDFKRLLIQYRNVNLPSSLWGVHKDPRKSFVSFTRFNPDFPDTNGMFVDRAVVFKGTLNPEAFVNGEKLELPEMFNVVETIYEASQVIEFVNNTVVSITHPPIDPSDEACEEL